MGVTESLGSRRKQRHNWRLGARWGPYTSGIYSQMAPDPVAARPGIRKAGNHEVAEVLRSRGQAGHPPSVATDAQLGFTVTAYQTAEVLFSRCGGGGHAVVRPTGTCARAQKGG